MDLKDVASPAAGFVHSLALGLARFRSPSWSVAQARSCPSRVGLPARVLTCSTWCPVRKGDPTCPDRQQYVGETGQTGEERFAEHRNTVVQVCHQGTTKPVGSHFQGPGHSVSDMRFTPIEQIYSNNIFVRKTRERRLINTLDLIRKGLNKKL